MSMQKGLGKSGCIFGLILVLLCVFLPFSEEVAAKDGKKDVVTVAFIPNRSPFSYETEEGKIDGITVDIMAILKEKSGLDMEFVMMPPGMSGVDYLEENPDAFIAGIMVDNPGYAGEDYLISDSFYRDSVVLVCRNGTQYSMDAPAGSYRLAVPKSYQALKMYVNEQYPEFSLVDGASTQDCLQMVKKGEADFAAQNVNILTPFLASPRYDDLQVLPTVFKEERIGIVCKNTAEHQGWIEELNRSISAISEEDIAQIKVDQVISNGYRLTVSDMLYKFRYPVAIMAVLIAIIFALMILFMSARRKNYLRLKEKNHELAEAVVRADNANLEKSRFLARISHEIRTPMNAIVGLTALAKHYNKKDANKVEGYLDNIDVSSKMLLHLINDVLDMSAIENHKMKLSHSSFDFHEKFAAIKTIYEPQCRQKGILLTVDAEQIEHNRLLGDGLRLEQILLNLVSNAYKFTGEGESITITAKEMEKKEGKAFFSICVKDTGEGMTEEMQKRLFLPYEQESAETGEKHGGSGLGLSIAKGLTEMMGGSISCHSKKGEGTSFFVSIPFEIDYDVKTETNEKEEEKEYDFHDKRVLLADDTQFNADITIELLSLVHMQTDHAENGKEAVEMFEKATPGTYEAILMDVQMPVMNGYEATKAIRGLDHPEAKTIPIIAMTANAFTEDVNEALSAGMNEHIAKPVDTEKLYSILDKIVKGRGNE